MKAKSLVKLVLSVLLCVVVLRFVDLHEVGRTLRNASIPYVLSVVVVYVLGQLLSAAKWLMIARAGGVDARYSTALRAYYIGMYVNCFGLGMVGGDVARGLMLAGTKEQRAPALASVLADRLHGLAILSFIGLFSVVAFGADTHGSVLLVTLLGCSVGITGAWIFGPSVVRAILPAESRFRKKVEAILSVFPRSPSTLGAISALSAVFHVIQISTHFLMGLALGVHLPLYVVFSVIPFVNILSSLPISWNGLGVRENSYRYFMSPHIITPEQAVAFGAMWLLAVTVSSAVGGIIAFLSKDVVVLREEAAETADGAVSRV